MTLQVFGWPRKATRDQEDPGTSNRAELLPPHRLEWVEEMVFLGFSESREPTHPQPEWWKRRYQFYPNCGEAEAGRIPKLFSSHLLISCCYHLTTRSWRLMKPRGSCTESRWPGAENSTHKGSRWSGWKNEQNNVNRNTEPLPSVSTGLYYISRGWTIKLSNTNRTIAVLKTKADFFVFCDS